MSTADLSFSTPIDLSRDWFMRRLIASLGHLNEAILGSDVAGAYVLNVGLSMGAVIEEEYKRFWEIDRPFTLAEYAHVIVDLKQKIGGNFSLVSKSPEQVVVRTTSCPFDAFVRQSPSLCFMTSSVFGGIAARNFGWAKVALNRRIALGDPGCHVTVYLRRTSEAEAAIGREYVPNIDQASPDIADQLRLMDNVRQLRSRLGEARSRWDEVVQGAADAICVLAPENRVIFANDRWRDLLGVEGAELVGGTLLRLTPPEEREATAAALARAAEGKRVTGHPCQLRHRDGSYRDVLASFGPLRDDSGQIVSTLAICHDVTREREAQRLRDEFVTTASHELRTPVTTIAALTDLMLRGIERNQPVDAEQLTRRLRMIREEADRLALLATDLLDATRLQAGKLRIEETSCDLVELVAAAVARQHDLLTGSDSHTIEMSAPATPVMVAADRPRIEQVLSNLLDNAVKFSPDGGRIRVETFCESTTAYVRITDEGIGIPAQDRDQLFSPFYRGSNASVRNFSGLGLGLYMSRSLIEAHGGTITMEPQAPTGSTFTIALPTA